MLQESVDDSRKKMLFFISKYVLSEFSSVVYQDGNHPGAEFKLLWSAEKTIGFTELNNKQHCFYIFRIPQARN